MNQRIPQNMAVIGGGTMGVGIAYVFAVAGWQVYAWLSLMGNVQKTCKRYCKRLLRLG
jgi:3-hydroxyacyl-CoA dehydrogenase